MLCVYGVDPADTSTSIHALVERGHCAPYTLSSFPLLHRCVPVALHSVTELLTAHTFNISTAQGVQINADTLTKAFNLMVRAMEVLLPTISDVASSKWVILGGLGCALQFSMFWIFFLRYFACILVWVFLSAILFGFAVLFAFSSIRYLVLGGYSLEIGVGEININLGNFTLGKEGPPIDIEGFQALWRNVIYYYWDMREIWLILSIVFGILFFLSAIIFVFLRNRIQLAVALIKEGSKAIGCMWSTLFWPLFPILLLVLAVLTCAGIGINLATLYGGEIPGMRNMTWNNIDEGILEFCGEDNWYGKFETLNGTARFTSCLLKSIIGDPWVPIIQAYNIFMGLWVLNFINCWGRTILAGSFATYYWAGGEPSQIPTFPLLGSIIRTTVFHLGSIAFGSFLLALVQYVRLLLMYLESLLKGKDIAITRFVLKCLQCLFYCLEHFLKYITKNAYILIASWGVNFCTAAKHSFHIITLNAIRVVVINKITCFIIFLVEIFATSFAVPMVYAYLTGIFPIPVHYNPTLHTFLIPLLIVGIGAFAISVYCFSVFQMAIDTLFMCAMEDLQRNDGSREKPYYMSKDLMEALQVK